MSEISMRQKSPSKFIPRISSLAPQSNSILVLENDSTSYLQKNVPKNSKTSSYFHSFNLKKNIQQCSQSRWKANSMERSQEKRNSRLKNDSIDISDYSQDQLLEVIIIKILFYN